MSDAVEGTGRQQELTVELWVVDCNRIVEVQRGRGGRVGGG
jgi:hypothetical protein